MFSKRFITVGSGVAVALFVGVTYVAVVSASHSWGNYHWERSSDSVSLTLGHNFPDDIDGQWKKAFDDAVSDWNFSSVLTLSSVAGDVNTRRCKPANGTIEVCADTYGFNGWLGIAGISVSGDHIVRAYAKMNDSYLNTATYSDPAWKPFVMCQEIGHDFGLGHQDEDFDNLNITPVGTCMDYTNDPSSNQQPNQHDYDQLEDIYKSHSDESEEEVINDKPCNPRKPGCDSGQTPPPPAFDMDLPDVGQWGELLGTSQDGGQSVFVQDFGNGHRVYTHVTWTLEIAEGLRANR